MTELLTPEAVDALLQECLRRPGEPDEGTLEVEGVVATYGLSRTRTFERGARIASLLRELPRSFEGGDSFLNSCMDREGRQWTGAHAVMEQLFVLGIATGQARWMPRREAWPAMPGGMPYITVDPRTYCAMCGRECSDSHAVCDRELDDGATWCRGCFPRTECGAGAHGEGCATLIHSARANLPIPA